MATAAPTVVSTPKEENKSYAKAREAYASGDVAATRQEHAKRPVHKESHKEGASEYVKSIVFGGLDGIMTTFAIVAAAAGSSTGYKTVLIFGFSNAIADAFSMGFGEFVSGNAERDFAISERKREEWEVEVDAEMEKQEMVELYESKGITHDDAVTMVNIISKDRKVFIDFMMVDELNILCDVDDKWEPLKNGLVMFAAFICFGMIPLIPYFFGGASTDGWTLFKAACFIVALALLGLGALKGHLTSMPLAKAAGMMLLNGCVSGVVSYGVSVTVQAQLGGGAPTPSSCTS